MGEVDKRGKKCGVFVALAFCCFPPEEARARSANLESPGSASMHLTSLSIYETHSHFYIIGTDATRIKYSVLKLDRNAKDKFNIGEPNHEYTKKDVEELLATISSSSGMFLYMDFHS